MGRRVGPRLDRFVAVAEADHPVAFDAVDILIVALADVRMFAETGLRPERKVAVGRRKYAVRVRRRGGRVEQPPAVLDLGAEPFGLPVDSPVDGPVDGLFAVPGHLRLVPGQRPLRPFATQPHRLRQRAGRGHARRRGDLAELVLVGHGPVVRAVSLAFARQARELGLEPNDPQHQLRRLGRRRGLPDLFEPGEQDLDLGPRRLAPQQPDLAHPLDDVGPLQQGVAGLARRALGITGPARRLGGVAAGDEMAAERLLPGR